MNIAEQITWPESVRDTGTYSPDDVEDVAALHEVIASLRKLEKPKLLWHHSNPTKRGVYTVKCDGPNPNKGFRYWDGKRWGAWSRTYSGARLLGTDSTIRKAPIKRPVMYATKGT